MDTEIHAIGKAIRPLSADPVKNSFVKSTQQEPYKYTWQLEMQ